MNPMSLLNVGYWEGRLELANRAFGVEVRRVRDGGAGVTTMGAEVRAFVNGGVGFNFSEYRNDARVRLVVREVLWAEGCAAFGRGVMDMLGSSSYVVVMSGLAHVLTGKDTFLYGLGYGLVGGVLLGVGLGGVLNGLVMGVWRLVGRQELPDFDYIRAMQGRDGGEEVRLNEDHGVVFWNRVMEVYLGLNEKLCSFLCGMGYALDCYVTGGVGGIEFWEFMNGLMQLGVNTAMVAGLGVFLNGEHERMIEYVSAWCLRLGLMGIFGVGLDVVRRDVDMRGRLLL